MEKFFTNVLVNTFSDPKVKAALAELVTPIIPLAVAAVAKVVDDRFTKMFKEVLGKDPDIPGLSNIFDLSETVRGLMNEHPDVNIPVIGDFLKGLGGLTRG